MIDGNGLQVHQKPQEIHQDGQDIQGTSQEIGKVYKFGVRVPRTVQEAKELDIENDNTL